MGSTKVELVADLRAKPPSKGRDALIGMAERGEFHDYDSELGAPKMILRQYLLVEGYTDLAQKVIDGAYDDEQPTYEQAMELRAKLGARTYDALMGGKPQKPGSA